MPVLKTAAPPYRQSAVLSIVWPAITYVLLGALSFATAYVQTNTAAVWIPSGFAVGFIIVHGGRRWPAVAVGSFALNAVVNLTSKGVSPRVSIAVALAIAAGNAGEAVLGGYLARRFAAGPSFFSRSRSFVIFALAVVPIAPLVSMCIGVTASRLGGLYAAGSLQETMLTWYVANAVGILIFTGPTVVILTRTSLPKPPGGVGSLIEGLLLTACIVFVSQAICGVYLQDSLRGWPKAYMITPLLFWASFRFGTYGALFAILLVTLISVVGTMRGFAVFPAESPSRSLIYLQIFLGMLSVMTLAISAGLSENWDLQANLEAKVRARTQDVERYVRERDNFTTLVAHDLQSPIYGVRNALRAAGDAIAAGTISPKELASALSVMDGTCSTLAERVASLLTPDPAGAAPMDTSPSLEVSVILQKIASAHRLSMNGKAASLRVSGDVDIRVRAPDQVEHILDILVDNAIKFSPPGAPIEISARRTAGTIEICVIDEGCGVAPSDVPDLFHPKASSEAGSRRLNGMPGVGLGLYLASEQAKALNGDLSYRAGARAGSTFCFVMPT